MTRKNIMLWGASSRSKVVNNLFVYDNKFTKIKNNFDEIKTFFENDSN